MTLKKLNITVCVPADMPQDLFQEFGAYVNQACGKASREFIAKHNLNYACLDVDGGINDEIKQGFRELLSSLQDARDELLERIKNDFKKQKKHNKKHK